MTQTNTAALEGAIAGYLAELWYLDPADLDPHMPLFSSGVLDSFAMMDLVSFVEREAGIEVDVKDIRMENFDSIARILAFVDGRVRRR